MVLLVKIIDGYKSQAKFVSFYLLLYSLVISVNIFIVKYILDNTYYYCDERSLQYDCDFSKTFYDANEYLITGSIISGVIFGLIIIIRSKDIIKSISVIIYTIIYGISINSNGFYQSYSKKYPTIDIGKAKFNSFLEKQITTFGEFLSLPFTLLSILLLLRVGILVWEKVFAGESYHLSRDFDVDKYPKIKDEKTINSVQTSNTNNNYVSGYENNNLVTEAEKSVEKIDDDGFISRYKYLLEPDYNYIIFDGFKFIIKIMIFHFLLYSLLMFINYKILDIIYENTYFVCEPKSGRYNCYLDPILYQATDALIWTIIIIGIITLVIITLRSKNKYKLVISSVNSLLLAIFSFKNGQITHYDKKYDTGSIGLRRTNRFLKDQIEIFQNHLNFALIFIGILVFLYIILYLWDRRYEYEELDDLE